jgi:hypothetical protein
MQIPVFWQGVSRGEVTVVDEAADTTYTAVCQNLPRGLYRLFVQGGGKLLLGTAESDGKILRLNRRFSKAMSCAAGDIRRGEIVRIGGETWEQATSAREELPAQLPAGALFRKEGDDLYLALPYTAGKPFAMTRYFCFACMERIRGADYTVFHLDSGKHPKI